MANRRDPLASLEQQIEKLEQSLVGLDRQASDAGAAFEDWAKKLASAEARKVAAMAGGATSTPSTDMNIARYSRELEKAQEKQEKANARYTETIQSLAKMRQELVETGKVMEQERLRRSGAASIFAGAMGIGGGIRSIGSGISAAINGETTLGGAAGQMGQGVAQVAGGIGQAAGGAVKMMTDLKAAGDLATGAFMGIASQVSGFVQAFAPATVEQFQLALRDLTAVIGMALQPLMGAFTTVIREVANSLMPIAQGLAPVFRTMGQVMVQVLTPALDTLASVVQSLLPAFEVFGQIVAALTPILRIGQTLIAGWVELFKSLIESIMPSKEGVKGFMDGFADAIKELASAVMKVVAFIARSLGGYAFIDGMIKSLTGKMSEKKDSTGIGAPTGAAFTNLVSFGQQVATRAFMATGDDAKSKTTEDWLKTLAEDLGDIRAGKGDLQTFLNEKLDQVGKKITDAILKLVPTEMIYSKGAEASTTLVSAAAASGGSPVALASNMLYQYLFGR